VIRFGPWLPDLPEFENPGALEAKNVVALTQNSYGRINDLEEVGTALTARCQGGGAFRGIGGTVFNTAGDATKLYTWDGDSWNDISRTAGGAYAVASSDMLQFTQFGDTVIAVNGTDAAQKYTIASSTNYAALGGSPPVGRFVCTIRDFVQIGRISGAKNRVQWSAINNAEGWTVGTDQSDLQDIPEGGQVMGMVGDGSGQGRVIMEGSVYSQTYIGSPAIFQFDKISSQLGCCAENSISTYEQSVFFLAWDGFHMIGPDRSISPIGDQQIDDYFWADVNQAFLFRVQGIVEPLNKRYIVGYPSNNSSTGLIDKLLIYSFTLGRWSRAEMSLEYMMPFLSSVGYNTDTIDAVIGNTDATSFLVDTNQFLGLGGAALAAFTPNHIIATFSGATLEALVDTTEAQITPGRQTFVREVWPYCDGGTLSMYLGTRDKPTDAVSWSSEVSMNTVGFCPFRSRARFHRGRVKVAAGGTWTHLQGIQPVGRAEGMY
jgi:hypothetical protein